MMKQLGLALALVLGIARVGVAANCATVCGSVGCCMSVSATPLSRLAIKRPIACQCDGDIPTNENWDYLDAHACTDDHPCPTTESKDLVVENLVAGDDNIEMFTARAALTLVSVTCHCDLNCGTPATLAFEDRSLNAINLTGGGDLTCGTGTAASTFTTFLTSDVDRLLGAGEGVKFSTTNTPTASQRITLTIIYTVP